MANNSNNNISPDVLGSAIAKIMSQLNQGRGNMSLDEKWVTEKKQVELDAIKRISDLSSSIVDVTAVMQKFNEKTSSIDVGDLGTKFEEMLKKHNDDIEEELQNFVDTLEENRKKLEQQQQNEAFNTVTNGKSGRIDAFGKRVGDFGNSLKKLGGNKGPVGALGKSFSGLGTAISKVAGPLGIMTQGLKVAHDWWTKSVDLEAKRYDLNAADIKQQHEIKQRQISGASQIASQNANVASATLSALSSAASSAQSAMGAFAQEAVGIHAELATEGKKIVYDAYATSHEVASSLPFDIKNGVYQAAEAAIDIGSRAQNYETSDKFANKALSIAAAKMSNQISGAYGSAAAAIEGAQSVGSVNKAAAREKTARDTQSLQLAQKSSRAEAKYTMESSRREINLPILGKLANSLYYDVKQREKMAPMNYNRDATAARNQTANAVTDLRAQVASTNANLTAQSKQTNIQLATQSRDMNLSIKKQQQDMKKNIEIAANEAAAKIQKAWLKMTEKLNDTFLKHQQASTVMGREMGMTGDKLAKYSDRMFTYQVEVSKFGKDLEWMQKAQGGYQESTGRNVEWSQNDYKTSAGMGMLLGDDTISEYVSGMEIFNHSVEDSNEKLYTMFKDVSKIGLNGKKYAKELAGSLKLAEKYNFKEGTKSLREMVKWAQNMRFNMGSLDGMLDKVQEGGLEGVIKQSAELQVLGGNFAMGSDPLAMAYESYMDPEAYAKRMNSMIAGQGMFDSKTGEVSFGIASQQMMRQYAKSTGQDYKDVLNQARTQVKMGQINGSFTDSQNFNEDQKMLIANKAQYDTETGKWKVQVGESKVDVDKLSDKDIEALTPSEDIEQSMLTELQSLRSIQEKYTAGQMENMATLEKTMLPNLIDTNNKILAAVGEEFKNNFGTYVTESLNGLKQLEQAPTTFFQMMSAGNDEVDAKRAELIRKIDDLVGTLQGVDDSSNGHIDGAMGQGVPTMQVGTTGISMPSIPSIEDEEPLKPEESKTFNWGLVGGGAAAGSLIGSVAGGTVGAMTGGVGGAVVGMGAGGAAGAAGGSAAGATAGAINGALIGGAVGLGVATADYFGWIDDGAKTMEDFNKWCNNTSETVSKWGTGVWDSITDTASSAWDSVTDTASSVWDGVTDTASSAWDSVTDTASSVWDGVTDTASSAWDSVTDTASSAWDKISNSFIGDFVGGVYRFVTGVVEIGWHVIKTVALSVWDYVKEKALGAWNYVKEKALGAWNYVKEKALGAWEYVKEKATGAWEYVKEKALGAWEYVKEKALGAWNYVKEKATGAWEYVKEKALGAWNYVKEKATGAWEYVKDKATGAWNYVKDKATGAWNYVKDKATGAWKYVAEGASNMWNKVAGFAKTFWGTLKYLPHNILNTCIKLVNSIVTSSELIPDSMVIAEVKIPDEYKWNDGKIGDNGNPTKINDGVVLQNGNVVGIDKNDQVLAAKQGGPVDKMLNLINNASQITPLPKRYDSFVRESLYSGKSSSDGKIEIAPIQININGNIQLTGSNGTIDITQQISNDPNFIRALTQMISLEVEKKARGGRTNSLLNRNLEF